MSSRQHAVLQKKVLSRLSGEWLLCCWDDCERPGYELHKAVEVRPDGETTTFVFCSERHKEYFKSSHRQWGFTA